MREVKFRGRDKNGHWHVGGYRKRWMYDENHNPETTVYIIRGFEEEVQVDPETVGQYTGLKDKNSTEIYEGDIVKGVGWLDKNEVYVVEFGNGEYYLEAPEGADYEYYNGDCPHGDRVDNWYESEVIGNIYDNPELIGA